MGSLHSVAQHFARLVAVPANRKAVQALAGLAAVAATLVALSDSNAAVAAAVGLVALLALVAIKLSLLALASVRQLGTVTEAAITRDAASAAKVRRLEEQLADRVANLSGELASIRDEVRRLEQQLADRVANLSGELASIRDEVRPDQPAKVSIVRSGGIPLRQTGSRMPYCPICGGTEFVEYNGRPMARCVSCGSFERHRVCFEAYLREGVFCDDGITRRAIQFAPEQITYELLTGVPGLDYITADLDPERYPHAQPMQLRLPDGLDVFPDRHFDFVIHNHVWEHIPGAWKEHVEPFRRILAVGGKMIFTVPYSSLRAPEKTVEGGELLPSDDDRLRVFGQADHVRRFGRDFLDHMAGVEKTDFRVDGLSDEDKRRIAGLARDAPEVVFILERTA